MLIDTLTGGYITKLITNCLLLKVNLSPSFLLALCVCIRREREELTVQLKRQMDEVRAKEEDAVLIEHQQALLMKEQNELYQTVSETGVETVLYNIECAP